MKAPTTIHELVALTRVPERTIRHYEKHGLLPRTAGEDGLAFYGERHVHLLAAIRYFQQAEGLRRLDVIKAKLDSLSDDDLSQFSFERVTEGEEADEEYDEEEGEEEVAGAVAASEPGPDARAAEVLLRRVVRPGLELLVRQDAGEDVQRIVAEICAKYGR
jgi:DNA-binding transcriptional MerR regulator